MLRFYMNTKQKLIVPQFTSGLRFYRQDSIGTFLGGLPPSQLIEIVSFKFKTCAK